MKVFLVVLLCCANLVLSDEWVPKTFKELKAIHDECIKERPLSEDQIKKMRSFAFPDEEPVRLNILCKAQKIGLFCPYEGYHADRIAKQANLEIESEALAIAQGCIDKNEQGSPTDVWAFRGHNCLMATKIGEKLHANLKKRLEEELKAQKE